MTTKSLDTIRLLLATAMSDHVKVKSSTPEENPYANHDTRSLAQGKGVLKASDQMPALSMTTKAAPRNSDIKPLDKEWDEVDPEGAQEAYLAQWINSPAHQIERARQAGLTDGHNDKSAKRMAMARDRAERKAQFDAIAALPVQPDPHRLGEAWMVVLPMSPIIEKIAASKARWASRYLGTLVDDVPQMVVEKMVLVLAKSGEDLDVLRVAAEQLGDSTRETGRIPGEQMSDEDRSEARRQSMARKWLMGMANNRVMGALADAYTEQRNLRWDNIDIIATVMTSISGVGEDPLASRHQADKPPSMLGSRYQRPGGIDPNSLSMTIAAAITAKGLDALVELMLDGENRRTDGAFQWTENAERVFMSTKSGAVKWGIVQQATAHLSNPRRARGDAARIFVRNTFEFLPGVIIQAVRSHEYETTRHLVFENGVIVAHMASEVEQYAAHDDGKRRPIMPSLHYATPADAAQAIAEHMAILITGDEIASSIAYA